ncbi:hypothetical protein B0H14DRAFT_2753789 [Mycena olivaceomarginata]|nr:hypothetical protein B0H14DRAFT_2753789 [Mycena olivaceomarginata]
MDDIRRLYVYKCDVFYPLNRRLDMEAGPSGEDNPAMTVCEDPETTLTNPSAASFDTSGSFIACPMSTVSTTWMIYPSSLKIGRDQRIFPPFRLGEGAGDLSAIPYHRRSIARIVHRYLLCDAFRDEELGTSCSWQRRETRGGSGADSEWQWDSQIG